MQRKIACVDLPFQAESALSAKYGDKSDIFLGNIVDCWSSTQQTSASLDEAERQGLIELLVETPEGEGDGESPTGSVGTISSSQQPSSTDSDGSGLPSTSSSSSSSSSATSSSAEPVDKNTYANYYYGTDDFQPSKTDFAIQGYLFYEYHEDASCRGPISHVLGQAAGPCYPGSATNAYRFSFSKDDCSDLRLSVYNDTQCHSFVQSLRVKHAPSCHKNQLSERYLAFKHLRCSKGTEIPKPIKGIHLQSHLEDDTCEATPVELFESIPVAQCLHAFESVSMVYSCDAHSRQYARTLYIGSHVASHGDHLRGSLTTNAPASLSWHEDYYTATGSEDIAEQLATLTVDADRLRYHDAMHIEANSKSTCMGFHDTKYLPLDTCTLQVVPSIRKQVQEQPPQWKPSVMEKRILANKGDKAPPRRVYQRIFCDDYQSYDRDTTNQDGSSKSSEGMDPHGPVSALGMGRIGGIFAIVGLITFAGILVASLVYCFRRWQKDGTLSLAAGNRYRHQLVASQSEDEVDNPVHSKKSNSRKQSKKKTKKASSDRGIELPTLRGRGSFDSADSEEGQGFAHDPGASTDDLEDRRHHRGHHQDDDDIDDDNAYTVQFAPAFAEEEQEDDDDDDDDNGEDDEDRSR